MHPCCLCGPFPAQHLHLPSTLGRPSNTSLSNLPCRSLCGMFPAQHGPPTPGRSQFQLLMPRISTPLCSLPEDIVLLGQDVCGPLTALPQQGPHCHLMPSFAKALGPLTAVVPCLAPALLPTLSTPQWVRHRVRTDRATRMAPPVHWVSTPGTKKAD